MTPTSRPKIPSLPAVLPQTRSLSSVRSRTHIPLPTVFLTFQAEFRVRAVVERSPGVATEAPVVESHYVGGGTAPPAAKQRGGMTIGASRSGFSSARSSHFLPPHRHPPASFLFLSLLPFSWFRYDSDEYRYKRKGRKRTPLQIELFNTGHKRGDCQSKRLRRLCSVILEVWKVESRGT